MYQSVISHIRLVLVSMTTDLVNSVQEVIGIIEQFVILIND